MPLFEMVQYSKRKYPNNIPLHFEEIACHFDKINISVTKNYSLHTEYSYSKRNLDNQLINNYKLIKQFHKNLIPQLWYSKDWAVEFANFIIQITKNVKPPSIIEIYPPFNDYTENMNQFIERYKYFEDKILNNYSNTQILIENRTGSQYKGGEFLLSKKDSFYELIEQITRNKLSLRIAFDVIQLYTAHKITQKSNQLISKLLNDLVNLRDYIEGVHLWGKSIPNGTNKRIAHYGNLNTYFYNNQELKKEFLNSFFYLFNDNMKKILKNPLI